MEKRYFEENRAVWRALEDAQAAGKVKVIGVSNFLRDDLEQGSALERESAPGF